MFIPNRTAMLHRLGVTTVNGERKYRLPVQVECAVVHLNQKSLKTTIRADSSASRGYADELTSVSKILFPINVVIEIEDKLTISGFTLKVSFIEPRYAVDGRHDHNEVVLEHWV